MVSVASSVWYAPLDKLQCTVKFVPRRYSIAVDTTAKAMTISPLTEQPLDIEPSGNLTMNIFYSLRSLAQISGSLGPTQLGNAVQWNAAFLSHLMANLTQDEYHTASLEDALTNVLKDLLVSSGQSQLIIAQDTTPALVTGTITAVRMGSNNYIFATLAIDIVLIVIALVEAVRTRKWSRMSEFDFSEPQSLIIASSAGGRACMSSADVLYHPSTRNYQHGSLHYSPNGSVRARLERSIRGNALILVADNTRHNTVVQRVATWCDEIRSRQEILTIWKSSTSLTTLSAL